MAYGSYEARLFGGLFGWSLHKHRPRRPGLGYDTWIFDVPAAGDMPPGRVSLYIHDNRTEFMFWYGSRADGVFQAERRARALRAVFGGELASKPLDLMTQAGRKWRMPVNSAVVIRKTEIAPDPTMEESCST